MSVAILPRPMKRLAMLSLAVITWIALLIAGAEGLIEARQARQELQLRAASLWSGISALPEEPARNETVIAEHLRKTGNISGAGFCATASTGANGAPPDFPWPAACEALARQEAAPFDAQGRHVWLSRHQELVIFEDVAILRDRSSRAFWRSFWLTEGVGVLLALALGTLWRRRLAASLPRATARATRRTPTVASPAPWHSWIPGAETSALDLKRLRQTVAGKNVIVIANREPYIHERRHEQIEVVRPASGLVTALEPVLRQAGGLWIGHGSGSADRETANARSEIAVPPGKPSYTLRRVWLTAEEENGYYSGFANEGLWPLCHLAHIRPQFRRDDWEHYVAVNRKFAESAPESSLVSDSLYLVQDYHFALVPRLLRERAKTRNTTEAPRISLFWHIPWPNPETFGICPWSRELLEGMLGADVLGFHTQHDCNNFLECCERYLEARVDRENFAVIREEHSTRVRPFPIGIETRPVPLLDPREREALRERYQLHAEFLIVGVDRLDYTKGIVERIEAVERLLEKYPEFVGRLTLAQIGSPSRTRIPAYRDLAERVKAAAERVNARFGTDGVLPVRLLSAHHDWEEIQAFYQLGDVCMVTSLHDGMNLVAKEYVWCQRADRGALILSRFTGASREFEEAFLVNPYDIDEMAEAIGQALALTPEEKAVRMNSMKRKVETNNAFHWATDLVQSLIAEVRPAEVRPRGLRLDALPRLRALRNAPRGPDSLRSTG